jgi:hypothetical protein
MGGNEHAPSPPRTLSSRPERSRSLRTRSGEIPALAFAVVLAFLAVIPALSVAEGEEPASRSRSERPFLSLLKAGSRVTNRSLCF